MLLDCIVVWAAFALLFWIADNGWLCAVLLWIPDLFWLRRMIFVGCNNSMAAVALFRWFAEKLWLPVRISGMGCNLRLAAFPLARPPLMLSAHNTHGKPPAEPKSLIGCVIIPIYGYDQTHDIEVQAVRAHMDSETAETPKNLPKMP